MIWTLPHEIAYLVSTGDLDEDLGRRLTVGLVKAGQACGGNFSMMNSAGKTPIAELEKHVTLKEFEALLSCLAKHPVNDDMSNASWSIYGM